MIAEIYGRDKSRPSGPAASTENEPRKGYLMIGTNVVLKSGKVL